MTRTLGVVAIAVIVALAAPAASAPRHRSGSSPPNTQSSGQAPNRDLGVTTGSAALGSGRAATAPSTSTDAAVRAENELIDRKLKGICRGC
jgi:hypothetical protein